MNNQNTGSSRKGISFQVNTELKYDVDRGRHYLEVMNSIAEDTTRMYYEVIDEAYVRNMPDQVLHGSYKQLKKEVIRRAHRDE